MVEFQSDYENKPLLDNIKNFINHKQNMPDSNFFDRLFDMGPENIDRVHWLFKPIEPLIMKMSEIIEFIHVLNGNHWIITIACTSIIIRILLLPIFYFHSKRIAKVGNKLGIGQIFKYIFLKCKLSRKEKAKKMLKVAWKTSRTLKLKPFNIAIYYMFLFPFITSTIFGLRKVMG